MGEKHPSLPMTPSWLTEACPEWCTRQHHEDDHPEDRLHRDGAHVFPAVFARLAGDDLRRIPEQVDLVVQRSQALRDSSVWVSIATADSGCSMLLTLDSAASLRARLPRPT